jgi:glyoxylase-like metal-dependent hydrolase (beta-lactamase superfamily II)
MIELTRRSMMGAAAAAAVAAPSAARAAAPPAGKQAPAFYRYKVGDIEVTQLSDGARTFPLSDTFVRNAKRDEVNAALETAFMPKDKLTIVFNPMVVNTGQKLVLIDAGFGQGAGPDVGLLTPNLTAAGIDPKAIDTVILSHLHPDHANGIITPDGALAFPNAEIKVPSREWAYWMDDGEMSRAPEGLLANYFKNVRRVMNPTVQGRVAKFESDKEVAPGITAIPTHGHTPGHTSFVIASGSARLLVQCDVTNHPALFARNPEWIAQFDIDGPKAIETRRKFYDMAVAERALIAGFHYPFPSLGHVEKDGSGYRVIPIAWSPSI